jgi:DNA-binding GntR family transcriptional regulator
MSQDDHRTMLDAARAGDTDRATAVLKSHIGTAAATIDRFFAER